MARWIFCFLLTVLVGLSFAAPSDELSRSKAGKRVTDYFAAFNSGDEAAMRKFISENFADSALLVRGVDDRMNAYRRMRQDMTKLEFNRVLKIDSSEVSVLAQTPSDTWLDLTFLLEPNSPYKFIGIRVAPADPSQANTKLPLLSEHSALDSISAMLQKETDADDFSGTVLIAQNGQSVLRKGYGLADREHKVENTPDTRFNLGSISKSFTRVAVERLISEGRMTATDTIGKFLPDYPNAEARCKVTVQQLMDHRGAISDFFGPEFMNTPRDRIRALKDYLPFFGDKPLEFPPGTQEQYSNGGYVLLGLIIEKVTGKSYYDYIAEIVFEPAGMKDSGWFESDQIVPNRAIGYTHRWTTAEEDSPELHSNVLTQPGKGSSAGGSYSTVDDLLKFSTALQQGKLHSSEGGQMGIAGGSPGVNAALESGLPNGFTVIVLCNLDPPTAERTARQIRAYLSRAKV